MQQRPEAEPEECAEAELEECHATAEPEEYYAPAEPEEDAVAQSEEHPADDPDQADDPAGLLRTRRGHSKSDPMCRVLETQNIFIVLHRGEHAAQMPQDSGIKFVQSSRAAHMRRPPGRYHTFSAAMMSGAATS